MSASPEQPVGVFDSGVGGLTVLHELLVSLPTEDYLYLGDTARFPYGDRTADELRRSRSRSPSTCSSRREAARRRLQLGQRGRARPRSSAGSRRRG